MILLLLSLGLMLGRGVVVVDAAAVVDVVVLVAVAVVVPVAVVETLFAIVVTPFELANLVFESDFVSADFSSVFFCTAATPT